MWRTLLVALLTLAAAGAFVACQNEETINEPQALKFDPPFDPNGQEQAYLAALYQYSESMQYDEINCTIMAGFEGTVSGYPESWGRDYECSIYFPPGSVPGFPGDAIPITIKVPHYDRRYNKAVYKLEPDMTFNSDVTVTLCYPPWLQCGPNVYNFCFFQLQNPSYYGTSDAEFLSIAALDGGIQTFTFETSHFSRWHPDPDK